MAPRECALPHCHNPAMGEPHLNPQSNLCPVHAETHRAILHTPTFKAPTNIED